MTRPLLVALALLAGCAQPVQRRDWSTSTGPGAEVLRRETFPPPVFPDALEPANRSSWALNDVFVVWVANPLGRAYRFVTPRYLRDRLRDFAANLEFPRNFVASWRRCSGSAVGPSRSSAAP